MKRKFGVLLFAALVALFQVCEGFLGSQRGVLRFSPSIRTNGGVVPLAAQISEKEAQASINKVVTALRKDAVAKEELGNLEKVTIVLGYGSPTKGSIAVRFNAAFKKGGFGLAAVPMPFGLGQTTKSEGRGTMVGQVKATVDEKTGKVTSCSVFRDLGYGRAFNLKC